MDDMIDRAAKILAEKDGWKWEAHDAGDEVKDMYRGDVRDVMDATGTLDLLKALHECTADMEALRASGDAGNWEWEEGDVYTRALAAIAKAEQK